MKKLLSAILTITHNLLYSENFAQRSKKSIQDFTRKRKVGFTTTMLFLLNFVRKSLQVEVDEFYDQLEMSREERATMDAFIKARAKVKPSAFVEIFRGSADACFASDEFPTVNGYRVFAMDGTTLILEGAKDILKHARAMEGTPTRAAARASVMCEVHTGALIDAEIDSDRIDERTLAQRHLTRFFAGKQEKDIALFDRGYPSKDLIHSFFKNQGYFLMRVSRSFNPTIDRMAHGEQLITLRHKGKDMLIRAVKFLLPSTQEETLITNLPAEDFPASSLAALYHLRWGVETTYDTLKNKMQLERFSGRRWDFVLQDFFATMFLLNIIAVAAQVANEDIARRDQGKTLKHRHVVSRNVLIGKLKRFVMRAVSARTASARSYYLNCLLREASKSYDCLRPDRTGPPRRASPSHLFSIRRKPAL